MAIHSRHPASAPPSAPEREKTAHLLLRGWCTLVFVLALGETAVVNAIGDGFTALAVAASALTSLALWLVLRPPLQYRRLPRFALAYVAWAALSLVWSAWLSASATAWVLLAATTLQGMFVAAVLSWRDVVRSLVAALKWLLTLSLLLELAAALFDRPEPHGVFGDANALAAVSALAVVVFGVRWAARAPHRGWLLVWGVLAVTLLVHADTPTAYLSLVAAGVVLATVLVMRTAKRPGERTRAYIVYAIVAIGGGAVVWFAREPLLGALGHEAASAGREGVWALVWERASQHPFIGWVGLVLLALAYLAFVWRAWFFAVDRPRYDLTADRPYSTLTLLPTLVGGMLLVQGLSEWSPLIGWGWMLIVLFGFKITQSPLVGVGPFEQEPPEGHHSEPRRAVGSR